MKIEYSYYACEVSEMIVFPKCKNNNVEIEQVTADKGGVEKTNVYCDDCEIKSSVR